MSSLNLQDKLSHRKGKRANPFLYKLMTWFVAAPQAKPMNLEVIDNVGVKKIKGPFIVISNHTSRCDWEYIGMAMKPNPLNFMASDVEFHRSHMHFIFDLMHVIPKKNFVSDLHCIRELKQVIADGGNVIFFPEGKSSISGTNQPIMPGTSELLKNLKVPVYVTRISGGYLSNTQWNIANRPGKVQITVDLLFTPEQLASTPVREMDDIINRAIYNDDFEWNKKMRVAFAGNENIAVKLEEHLYRCPRCEREMTMRGEGNRFVCTACGNGAVINEYDDLIPLDDTCAVPKNLRVWFELQRRAVYREIRDNPDFMLQEPVTIGHQPDDHYVDKHVTSEPIGEGMLTLTRDSFTFDGLVNGQPFTLTEKTANMLSVVFETDSSNFGAFFKGKYYEFKPKRPSCTKWLLSVEECHRAAGGRWQNTLPAQQWIYEDDKPTDKENYFL